MSNSKKLLERGVAAAERYLKLKEFDVLEVGWECPAGKIDLIARDPSGDLVFADVRTRVDFQEEFTSEPPLDEVKRARFERIAMWYLRDFEVTDVAVRYDMLDLTVVQENRAFLRHWVNASSQLDAI